MQTPPEVHKVAYSIAEKWLKGWGSVLRDRQETGDPSSIPREEFTTVRGRRSSPSNIPDILSAFIDVEDAIRTYRGARIGEALRFVYVAGFEFQSGNVTYTLPDRTTVTLPATAAPPVAYASVDATSHRVDNYDLNAFPIGDAALSLLLPWGATTADFVQWRLADFRRHLIRTKSIRPLAAEAIRRGLTI